MSRDLILIALSMCTWGIGEGMFMYFQPLYLEELGASPLQIGAILGAVGVIMSLTHIPAGYLADRIGRRPLLWAAWTLGLLSSWIMALSGSLSSFVAGMLLYAVTAFVMAPLNSYITAARGRWSVNQAISVISASYNVGAFFGPFIGGQIGERIGLHAIYLIAASIFVVSTGLIYLLRRQPVENQPSVSQPHRSPLRDKFYLAYLGVVFLAMFATYLPQPLSPNYLRNTRALTLEQIGVLGSITSLGIVILNLGLGRMAGHTGFILGQFSVGIYAAILWQGTGFGHFVVGHLFLGGYRAAKVLASAQARRLVHVSQMGIAYGSVETVTALALILAPVMAGGLYQPDPTRIYLVSIGLIILSVLVSIRFIPRCIPFSADKNHLSDP